MISFLFHMQHLILFMQIRIIPFSIQFDPEMKEKRRERLLLSDFYSGSNVILSYLIPHFLSRYINNTFIERNSSSIKSLKKIIELQPYLTRTLVVPLLSKDEDLLKCLFFILHFWCILNKVRRKGSRMVLRSCLSFLGLKSTKTGQICQTLAESVSEKLFGVKFSKRKTFESPKFDLKRLKRDPGSKFILKRLKRLPEG